nr:retrotransposon protein [Tanacetum cinerariifolium]
MMVANSQKHHCRVRPYTREVLVFSINLEIQTKHYSLVFRNHRGDEARIKKTGKTSGLVTHDLEGHKFEILEGSGGESFWEECDDFRVDGLRFHTCLTDILGFLEKLKWWFEQDIDDEEGEDEEGEGSSEKKVSPDRGPINMGGPFNVLAAPKANMGPPPGTTPGSEKNSGCSKHMTGKQKLFSTYKAYNGGNVIFGSNLHGNIIGKGQTSDNKCRVTFSKHDSGVTKDGKVIDEEEAIKVTEKKNLENDTVDETLEIDEIVNIKESRNHPLENIIGKLNHRTLISQAQNQSNFFYFISTIEPKNVNEALTDDSWIVAMQEELNQFIANDV